MEIRERYGLSKFDLTEHMGTTYVIMDAAWFDEREAYGFEAPVWPLADYEYGRNYYANGGEMPIAHWVADWSKTGPSGTDYSDCCDWQHADMVERLYNTRR